MLKRLLILVAVTFVLLGAAPALAQYNPTTTQISPSTTSRSVVDPGTAAAGTSTGAAPTTTASFVSPSTTTRGSLPTTGSDLRPLLAVGAGLVVAGGLVVLATRRRATPAAS